MRVGGSSLRFLLVIVAAGLAASAAHAGGYVGAAAGQGNTEFAPDPQATFDASSTSYKLYGGYRFMKFFGIEADYRDFGKPEQEFFGETVTVDTTALDLFAVGAVPIGSFEFFGKLGYTAWDASISALGEEFSDDGNDMAYGLGFAYVFNKFSVRLEYEQFDIEDADNISMATVGFDFRF